MKLYLENKQYIDTEQPLDISIPLSNTDENPRAWYVGLPEIAPVRENGFTGSVAEGGSVNFRSISFNPHGHGTHTECLGHITQEVFSVNQSVNNYFFTAELISIEPESILNVEYGVNDLIIKKEQLKTLLHGKKMEALVIRTLPNQDSKKHLNYTETNPPYLSVECIEVLNECGVNHLLIDLPSVDRESDNGVLAFHHAFWQVPFNQQYTKTITELIFVRNEIKDGSYILELQTAPFENDATPSRPVLYELNH